MKIGLVTIAYNEERFITPFLKNVPKWVDETLVLVSQIPWQGKTEMPDETDIIAEEMGATVIINDWKTEQDQRNAGQEYFHDFDWIITLDPDEYLDKKGWKALKEFIDVAKDNAYVCSSQFTYWKSGYVIDPGEEYTQIILTRPTVRYGDKRVVNSNWGYAPVVVHHFSWARTDSECLSKISHYAHAHELDHKWYEDVWLKWTPEMENLHPLSPEALKRAIPAKLPKELEALDLWP